MLALLQVVLLLHVWLPQARTPHGTSSQPVFISGALSSCDKHEQDAPNRDIRALSAQTRNNAVIGPHPSSSGAQERLLHRREGNLDIRHKDQPYIEASSGDSAHPACPRSFSGQQRGP